MLDDPVTARSLRRLHIALTGPEQAFTELERHEQLTATARLLVRHAASGATESAGPSGPDARVAARIRELIHDGYATDLTAEDLAAAAGCSRYAAYRAFSGAYGLAPSEYQRQLRVRAARRMLSRGVPPAAAAAQAGFADQAHLTRWFRRYYGITPGAYRGAVHLQPGLGVLADERAARSQRIPRSAGGF